MDSPTLRRIPDKHGNLQRNHAALDEFEGLQPGVYTVDVTGLDASSAISPVSSIVLVWQPSEGADGI